MELLPFSDVEVQARVRRASSQSRSPERRSPLQYDAAPGRYLNDEDSKHSDGSSSAGSPVATSASRAVEEPDELNDFEKELEALHAELHAQEEKKKRMVAGAEMKADGADGDSQQERKEGEDDSSEEEDDSCERFERRSSRGATREWCHQQ